MSQRTQRQLGAPYAMIVGLPAVIMALLVWGRPLIGNEAATESQAPVSTSSESGSNQPSDSASPEAPTLAVPASGGVRRITGRSGFFERLEPRPLETPEQLQIRTQQLRETYSKPTPEWPAPLVDEGVVWEELGLLPKVQHPESNPFTKEKAALGRMLFFDPRLSATSEMSCASCHDPDIGWADGRTVSFGLGRAELKRNAPSIMNVGLAKTLFWDGRADSLEDQAEQVLLNEQEMACSEELLVKNLSELPRYQQAFKEVFGDQQITLERVAQAIACFERTIVGGRSPFDAFLKGKHETLSDSAIRGLHLFRNEARCMNCHSGPLLTDHQFHDIGLSYYGRKFEDLGRYQITTEATDSGRFRTPSLRNIANTRPYMHNGLFELPNALRMYNMGMPTLVPKEDQREDKLFPKKSPLLKPLGLNNQDLEDLEAFLESLSEPRIRHRPPVLPQMDDVLTEKETSPEKT